MTHYNFDLLPDRRNSDSAKWGAYDPDVLPLWVADMDFLSPEPVIQALRQRVEHGIFGYPLEMPELFQAIVDWLAQRYQWQVSPEEVFLLPGVVTGINLACHAVGKPGQAALIQTPIYPPFLTAPHHAGLQRQQMQLTFTPGLNGEGSYEIDFDAFKSAIDGRTRLFLLCNPHNPVGRVFRREELERMAELCLQKDLVICSDEIHCDLVFPGHPHIPIATLAPEIARRTITLMAPSKTFNIAGLECAFAVVTDPELRKKFRHADRGLIPWVNLMGQVAAIAAYRHGLPWLEQVLQYLQINRDIVVEFVRNELPGVRVTRPEGTYLAWLDCRSSAIRGNPYQFFLEKARVALNDGRSFGPGGEGFVRLNFGCPKSVLLEALERMKEALRQIS